MKPFKPDKQSKAATFPRLYQLLSVSHISHAMNELGCGIADTRARTMTFNRVFL